MYGTWCKAHVIPEKLTVKMENNGRQQFLINLEQNLMESRPENQFCKPAALT